MRRKVYGFPSKYMGAITEELDATIGHEGMANHIDMIQRLSRNLPIYVVSVLLLTLFGYLLESCENAGREGRALWITVVTPTRSRTLSNMDRVDFIASWAMKAQRATFSAPEKVREFGHAISSPHAARPGVQR